MSARRMLGALIDAIGRAPLLWVAGCALVGMLMGGL